jgi:hypothetical protein
MKLRYIRARWIIILDGNNDVFSSLPEEWGRGGSYTRSGSNGEE